MARSTLVQSGAKKQEGVFASLPPISGFTAAADHAKLEKRLNLVTPTQKAIDRESLARLASRSWSRTIFCMTQPKTVAD
jgi:hypothetical protein